MRTVGDAMLTVPTRHPLATTVREIQEFFRDDHVHAALIVSPAGYLAGVVERDDITDSWALMPPLRHWGDSRAAHRVGRGQLAEVQQAMNATGRE